MGAGAKAAAIRSALPELELIQDGELRENVVDIWVEAWEGSTWETLQSVPKNIGHASNFSLMAHIRTVARGCADYARTITELHGLQVDMDLLIAGALLHDVCKLVEYDCESSGKYSYSSVGKYVQHGIWGAHKAMEKGLPWPLVHLIITHTHDSGMPPKTLEGLILHYVDYLDTDAMLIVNGKPLLLKW